MDNPEYTVERINRYLADATKSDVRIHWNGNLTDDGSAVVFNVWFNGDDTPFYVRDYRGSFEITEHLGDRRYQYMGYATTYEDTAAKLAAVIGEALAIGQLTEEEDA